MENYCPNLTTYVNQPPILVKSNTGKFSPDKFQSPLSYFPSPTFIKIPNFIETHLNFSFDPAGDLVDNCCQIQAVLGLRAAGPASSCNSSCYLNWCVHPLSLSVSLRTWVQWFTFEAWLGFNLIGSDPQLSPSPATHLYTTYGKVVLPMLLLVFRYRNKINFLTSSCVVLW